jgi:hypothetical protein
LEGLQHTVRSRVLRRPRLAWCPHRHGRRWSVEQTFDPATQPETDHRCRNRGKDQESQVFPNLPFPLHRPNH